MKNKPNEVTATRRLSAEIEHIIYGGDLHRTLKKVEEDMVVHETHRPVDARSDSHEHSVLQYIPRQGRACPRCPLRLDCSRALLC
jgi:hypothetical protein